LKIEKNPTNRLYPFYLGIAYASILDDKKSTEAVKKDAFIKAEEAYKKAIAVDPSYGDAYINLGGLIMNNGIGIFNKANKIPTNKVAEYNAMKKLAITEFDRALPYLEKATQLNPKSELALRNLHQYYNVKNNPTKAAEVAAKIKALNQ
jgi:tetratricopeptide (TPR) repeat protein